MKKTFYTAAFLLLTALLLIYPQECLNFALNGLNLWFQKMVPTLLPFMILSGMMIRMNLTDPLIFVFKPVLKPLFQLKSTMLYVIAVGFLCGFPMGARVTADLYERRQINQHEATYLLAFTNNIGPIYFISFALPLLGFRLNAILLCGMYGIPLGYGLLLRYTFYRRALAEGVKASSRKVKPANMLKALDDSVAAGLEGITKLGGYMILFNLINIIPYLLLSSKQIALGTVSGILEITGGLKELSDSIPIISLILLTFGGFSCFAQTYSLIAKTDLSIRTYIYHKMILTLLASLYYIYFFYTP